MYKQTFLEQSISDVGHFEYIQTLTQQLEHFFISCPLFNKLWHVIISNLSKYIAKTLNKLSNIVPGYNNSEIEHFDLNLLFTIVGFNIYKYNVVSENRTKHCNY